MNLNWVYIAISWVLLRWHDLWSAVFGSKDDIAWVLAIVFLVLTMRTVLFPVFVKQIKSQRAMQTLQPQVKALQEKHKGDKETLQKEVMELYRREKANPLMGCLPIALQIPVFLGLFHVLKLIDPTNKSGRVAMIHEYFWASDEFASASNAKLFGAPLASAFRSPAAVVEKLGASQLTVQIVAACLIATMVATTYITQRQMIARTGKNSDPTQAMVQKLMLYGIPASLLVSGALFPIGVVIYWVTTNLFSMGQQFWVLKKMPPPNVNGKVDPKAKEVSVEAAKALAPRPGVKPANPKKGARPARIADAASAPSPDGNAAGPESSTPTAPASAGPAGSKPGRPAPGGSTPAGSKPGGSVPSGSTPGDPDTEPAGSSASNSGGSGGRRPQDARNRKRKGGRR